MDEYPHELLYAFGFISAIYQTFDVDLLLRHAVLIV